MSSPVEVVAIAGSPSSSSRSSALLALFTRQLEARGRRVRTFALTDFDAQDLLYARANAPTIAPLLEAVRGAKALLLATPVYKAVYAGALKSIVDLIPPDGLEGKAAFALASAKLDAHGETVTRAFTELFAFFRGVTDLGTLFALDRELTVDEQGGLTLGSDVQQRTQRGLEALLVHVRRS